MKKLTAFLCVCVAISIVFCSCSSILFNQYIPSLSCYAHTTFSYGISEIIRLDKYYYSDAVDFVNNTRYTQIKTDSQIKRTQDYVDHFTQLYNKYSDETNEKFAFNPESLVKMNDYYTLKTSEGQKNGELTNGKYDSYTLYYLDFYNWKLYVFTVNEYK